MAGLLAHFLWHGEQPSTSCGPIRYLETLGVQTRGLGCAAATLALAVALRRAAALYREAKTHEHWDPASKSMKIEHRNTKTVLLIMFARTGLLRSDSRLFQFVAGLLTREFRKADDAFAATGADPKEAIRSFCATHGIRADVDAATWEWSERPEAYASINEFFMRRYARGLAVGAAEIASPATSVVRRYDRLDEMACVVKGETYTLERCGVPEPGRYAGQAAFYFYLSPADYHCFHSPIDGTVEAVADCTKLATYSASVKPDTLAGRPSILTHNRRFVAVFQAASGLRVAIVVLGGFLVDSIRLDAAATAVGATVQKGQFLGSFALGGSAILMLTDRPLAVDEALAPPRPGVAVKVAAGAAFASSLRAVEDRS